MSSDQPRPFGSSYRDPFVTPNRDVSSDTVDAEYSPVGKQRRECSDEQRKTKPGAVHPSSDKRAADGAPENRDRNISASVSIRVRSRRGFLLNHAGQGAPSDLLSRAKHTAPNAGENSKRDSSGSVTLRRQNRHSHRSSIGSSPLATKVSTLDDDEHRPPRRDGQDPDRLTDYSSSKINSSSGNGNTDTIGIKPETTGVEYDTDPVQIVNMALTLSEGRRRQTSAMRLAASEIGVRRSTASAQQPDLGTIRPQSSLGKYLTPHRQSSRQISPQATRRASSGPTKSHEQPAAIVGSYIDSILNPNRDADVENALYDLSDATLVRVQQAKDHFELLYEYRRLLAHLPPLRRLAQMQTQPSYEGRSYNPLQYARNRKLRFQEKEPFESDAEGWHDVQQVRAWVTAVIEGHTERRLDPDQCIRLPELHPFRTEVNQENRDLVEIDSSDLVSRKGDAQNSTKPRRPRSDWTISPGVLLADAYWLEQGLNKTKIEDRYGDKLYSWGSELKYTDWRNRAPALGQGREQPSPSPPAIQISRPIADAPASPPELPTFTSTGRRGRHRGRRLRREPKSQMGTDSEDSGKEFPKNRKRLAKDAIRSWSRSSTSESDDEKDFPKPLKGSAKTPGDEFATESGNLDHYVQKMSDRDTQRLPGQIFKSKQDSVSRSHSTTKDHMRHDSGVSSSKERTSSKRRRESGHQPDLPLTSFKTRRLSRSSLGAERPTRSSLDYDTTAPSSPSVHQFPSITIDLSPTPSRSPSPTKKVLHSRINPFRDRNQSKHQNGIDATGFADSLPSSSPRHNSLQTESETTAISNGSRDTSPMTKSTSRISETAVTRSDTQRAHNTISKLSAKTPHSPEAVNRIRGIFKGGRIAELVGNEVSRVGDFIWKREPPSSTPRSSSSDTKSRPESDTEEEVRSNDSVLRKPPQPHSIRLPSPDDDAETDLPAEQLRPPFRERQSYYMSNLPSFTSPFQKDHEVQKQRDRSAFPTSEGSPPAGDGSDHISMAAAHHKSVSKSLRMDGLAPPKLNTSPPTLLKHSQGHSDSSGIGKVFDLAKTTSASHGLNDILSRSRGPPVTGLTSLEASKPSADLANRWDPASREISGQGFLRNVTKKDIARARALLLSSGAKARQISLRAHLIRPHPPKFLLRTITLPTVEKLDSLRVPRKDEYMVAALNLVSKLTSQSCSIRSSMDHFTSTTCPDLHTSLQALDDLVENGLTPRVRAAADEHGELSMKLTTTSTLAVKGLNDVIEGAMRRRRRGPVRWLRRIGYGVVEWLVVGLLWGIWLVVSIVRLAVGVGTGAWMAVRWLLWLA